MAVNIPDLAFVPTVKAAAKGATPIEQIPQELIEQVEQVYKLLQTNEGNFHAEFANKAELAQWEELVKSYCAQRMADGKPAPITYRRSPVRGQQDGHVNFRITDLAQKNEADSQAINDAAEKVTRTRKAAAKTAE